MKRNICSIIVVAVIMFFIVGVAMAESHLPKKVGICLPEAATDKGWNEQGAEGFKKVAKKYGFEGVIAEGLGYGDIKPTIRDMVSKGCGLIITHAAGYGAATPEMARELGVKMVTCLNHKDVTPGLISNYDFRSGGGGYLAGVLAGRMTRSNIVGMCAGAEPSNFNRLSGGFAQGLKSVKPDAKLIRSVIGPFGYGDAPGGKRNVSDQIAVGADVIFGMGDGSTFGMIQACSNSKAKDGGKVWFIDVIGNKKAIDNADILLTSVIFDFSVLWDEIIQTVVDGTFGKDHWLSFRSGAMYLLELNKAVPQQVAQELNDVREKMMRGEIEPVEIPDAGDLKKYIAEIFPKN